MSANAKVEQKPMGIGAVLGFLILTTQYVVLAWVVVSFIRGML